MPEFSVEKSSEWVLPGSRLTWSTRRPMLQQEGRRTLQKVVEQWLVN